MFKKRCKDCGIIKSIKDFYGVQGECKECSKKRIRLSSKNIIKKCLVCNKDFGTCSSEIKRGSGKFCSRECWNKWYRGKNTYNWKGDKAGYSALHKWIKQKLGSPNYCEHCKTTKAKCYHWSNISGRYLRKVSDWQRLCVSCHSKYDLERRKEYKVKCIVCGKTIQTKSKKRKFCSKKCSSRYYREH